MNKFYLNLLKSMVGITLLFYFSLQAIACNGYGYLEKHHIYETITSILSCQEMETITETETAILCGNTTDLVNRKTREANRLIYFYYLYKVKGLGNDPNLIASSPKKFENEYCVTISADRRNHKRQLTSKNVLHYRDHVLNVERGIAPKNGKGIDNRFISNINEILNTHI